MGLAGESRSERAEARDDPAVAGSRADCGEKRGAGEGRDTRYVEQIFDEIRNAMERCIRRGRVELRRELGFGPQPSQGSPAQSIRQSRDASMDLARRTRRRHRLPSGEGQRV